MACLHRWSLAARTLAGLLFALGAGVLAQPLHAAPLTNAQPAGQTLLIQFTPDTTEAQRTAQIAAMGAELVHWLPQIQVAEVQVAEVQVAEVQVSAAAAPAGDIAAAAAVPAAPAGSVVFVEPDLLVAGAYLPTDPAFSDPAQSYAYLNIQAPAAWEVTRGSRDVVVAVIDSGIALDHAEFAGRLLGGYDFVDEDPQPEDESGHGTHTAGIIAAGMDNGAGAAGVCPNCSIMPIRVLNAANLGSWADLARGVLYAVDYGADIINLSLGAPTTSQTLEAAIAYAVDRGVVVVAAGGNFSAEMAFYPAALSGVIGVGATTSQDTHWRRSNSGSHIDLTAPGDLIYSAYHLADNTLQGYTYMSGTSMATPFVSGLAGLALSLQPSLTPVEVSAALAAGADDLGPPGWDPEFGHGRINAARALTAAAAARPLVDGTPAAAPVRVFLPAIVAR